jgi:hypothetical protein
MEISNLKLITLSLSFLENFVKKSKVKLTKKIQILIFQKYP